MRKTLSLIILSFTLLTSAAQDKLNPAGRLILNDYKKTQLELHMPNTDGQTNDAVYTAIIVLNEEFGSECLSEAGVDVKTAMDNVVIADIPLDRMDFVTAMKQVKAVSFGELLSPTMDYARLSCSVSDVQNGFTYAGKSMAFDGAGVVCGLMDTGIDPNHVNFNNADGASRVKRLWFLQYNTSNGKVTSTDYTEDNIRNFKTDNSGGTHATHVAGIMGGSYNGEGNYAYIASASGKSVSEMTGNIPFYGVATGADLAFSVGQLYSSSIIQGIDNIVSYAESVGKPSVVNLSLGHTSGPHDGTDAYSQALAKLGKRTIICMSAGNDGDIPMSITKEFTTADTKMMTQLNGNKASGAVDIWGNDNKAFTVKWALYDLSTQTFTYLDEVSEAGQIVTINASSNPEFASCFNGSITMRSNVNTLNDRYNVYCDVSVQPLSSNENVFMSLIVEGSAGQKIYVYGGTDVSFSSQSISGWSDGSKANSINDGACAENVISVGAYTTRTTWGVFGNRYGYYNATFKLNKIAPFSSYGTSFQGKQLPLVCAPGAGIVSSYSRFYVAAKGNAADMTASATVNGVTNYWSNMQGTSMSCPYVSGVIGLWLQADPALTFDRVIDVINNSSTYSSLKNGTPKAAWGAGAIDALAGMKYVLENRAALGQVWADPDQRLIVTASETGYEVFVADGGAVTATLYDLQGRPVARTSGTDGTATVDASSISHGVYILEARGADYRLARKVTR